MARLCKNVHRAYEHGGFNPYKNGEASLLRAAVSKADPVFFDVGSNCGQWALMAAGIHPGARIFSFEIDPRTRGRLATATQQLARHSILPYGLGCEEADKVYFAYTGDQSELSSIRAPLLTGEPYEELLCKVRRGDAVASEIGVDTIDFLKIDTEGYELEVWMGFREMLKNHRIKVVQFEHQGGRFLVDFYRFLTPLRYRIGKLYSRYVDFRDHLAKDEEFLGPNYVAAPSEAGDLIHRLRVGWTGAQ